MIEKIATNLTAFELYTIFKDDNYSFILDSNLNNNLGRYSLISANPFKVLDYNYQQDKPLEKLKMELAKYKIENTTNSPFIGGAVGYLSYDLCHCIENLPKRAEADLQIPDLYFGLYNWGLVVDHQKDRVYFASPNLNQDLEVKIKEEVISKIKEAENNSLDLDDQIEISATRLKSNFTKSNYLQAIRDIQRYIEAGTVYQVNLSQKFSGQVDCSSYQLYRRLREISPAPFAAFLNFSKVDILSNSPERFIQMKDRVVKTRPIKGTRPRGVTPLEDKKLKEELLASEKDKAELLMIVDLVRNDLAKVSQTGSVEVPKLYSLEEYANVHHLVATVKSKLQVGQSVIDLIKAVFPGGSITGAPKIKAMEIIDQLEPSQRNLYTGSIGYLGFDGTVDLNIAIRTIIKQGSDFSFQVGGGITWDSDPLEEYNETLHKAESIMEAVKGYYAE